MTAIFQDLLEIFYYIEQFADVAIRGVVTCLDNPSLNLFKNKFFHFFFNNFIVNARRPLPSCDD